ncbi:Rv3235 family protein [Solwaraspora sp. WMMA2080]|uniref:Rv3235 family protein n=1 Tax=unclassified Solwaraspora TaxID=2627926 RepID=UPI00248BE193|nr:MULTISPECIES: Rv3235 family protein [unclassified Solwaraspora]WBB96134.1 Rv3235 family protein [Solwaraspora sp. WMMA2059]WBC19961.1 Rv3235 family protein [Solwaraspora sp. WMMA2080]
MTVATRIRRPPVRLRPAPPLDPPFTDEPAQFDLRPGPHPGVQLALDLAQATPGAVVTDRSATTAGPPADGRRGLAPDALAGASPEARRAAHRFLAASLEIINGFRPAGHIRRLADPAQALAVGAQLAAAVDRARRPDDPGRVRRGPASPQPTPVTRGKRRTAELLRVRQLRVCEPASGVAEAVAVLGTTERSWALAFRLERRPTGWLTVTVDVV